MIAQKSDKAGTHHNYTLLYDYIFSGIKLKHINFLEIGIGSINKDIPSNMCGISKYQPGASIRAWRKYFDNAKIFGGDIDTDIIDFPETDILGFYIDQRDITQVYTTFYERDFTNTKFDIIIDDGLHHFETNINVMNTLLPKVNKNGWYIIEDVIDYNPDLIQIGFPYKYQYITIENPHNNKDNNLFIVYKEFRF